MLVNADDHVVPAIPKTTRYRRTAEGCSGGGGLQGENATIEATADGKPLLQWTATRGLSSTANSRFQKGWLVWDFRPSIASAFARSVLVGRASNKRPKAKACRRTSGWRRSSSPMWTGDVWAIRQRARNSSPVAPCGPATRGIPVWASGAHRRRRRSRVGHTHGRGQHGRGRSARESYWAAARRRRTAQRQVAGIEQIDGPRTAQCDPKRSTGSDQWAAIRFCAAHRIAISPDRRPRTASRFSIERPSSEPWPGPPDAARTAFSGLGGYAFSSATTPFTCGSSRPGHACRPGGPDAVASRPADMGACVPSAFSGADGRLALQGDCTIGLRVQRLVIIPSHRGAFAVKQPLTPPKTEIRLTT